MRTQTIDENRRCPKCGLAENQINAGYNRSGTQRCVCKFCRHKYTLNGKTRAYSEEKRRRAIKAYHSGMSGRGVGKLEGIGKGTVYNWIRKNDR
ncbi:MAG: helix-turn-helix domain-containing protein [Oscillospiraceae bacterium]|jgi:transposase-like protein|nr:helix-turn-helix domain-containing protein [Oscillospiraceae bacterium]